MREDNNRIKAKVVNVGENKVIVLVEENGKEYRIGQNVVATVPMYRKTGLGNWINIAEIVAQGAISDVDGKKITIDSKHSAPVISSKALRKVWEEKASINLREVENVFYG